MIDHVDSEEQPRKRVKLSYPEQNAPEPQQLTNPEVTSDGIDEKLQKEIKCGITSFINPDTLGFSGILKQRYTDFLVNEILPSGEVLHLRNLKAPSTKGNTETEKPTLTAEEEVPIVKNLLSEHNGKSNSSNGKSAKEPTHVTPAEISLDDVKTLTEIFGPETAAKTVALHKAVLNKPNQKPRDFNPVISYPITDKEVRTTAHQAVRRIFSGRLETTTESDNTFKIVPAAIGNRNQKNARQQIAKGQLKGKLGWQQLGGEYLHFTLLKENRDTMEAVGFLAKQLHVKPRDFGFAGTKDRRGVTVQRVSVYRINAAILERIGQNLRGSMVGDYEYQPNQIELSELGGNEFVITLRDCKFPDSEQLLSSALVKHANEVVEKAVHNLEQHGFINYYGLQRFGSFESSTDQIGRKLLQGDLSGAVDDLLKYSPKALAAAQDSDSSELISQDEKNRALGIYIWATEQNATKALNKMHYKFSAEREIIKHLGWTNTRTGERPRAGDYQGAFMNVPRNLRLMYVHAYQSLVWNMAAGKRMEKYGDKVVEGDLVIIKDEKPQQDSTKEEFDEHGEPIIRPAIEDRATTTSFTRARPLSKDEAESGKYSIFDIVLPQPGWDVVYPANEIGKFYEDYMGSEEGGKLNPHDMRRGWKDISLSGSYRAILGKPSHMGYEVREYIAEDEQLVETDADRLKKKQGGEAKLEGNMDVNMEQGGDKKIAVILKMQLGSSTYATMALRELMKAGGVRSFNAVYSKK